MLPVCVRKAVVIAPALYYCFLLLFTIRDCSYLLNRGGYMTHVFQTFLRLTFTSIMNPETKIYGQSGAQ